MSASCSSESSETKVDYSPELSPNFSSRYALYLFNNNKHAGSSDSNSDEKDYVNNVKCDSKSELDEPTFCLSLLEGNLGAEQETVVRCYLLKTLSAREDLNFENEGKYAVLQFSDSEENFGCYYHRLSKYACDSDDDIENKASFRMHTFFICLIGPSNGIMESFCSELGIFCCNLIPLLDPEGLKNQEHVQLKLKTWYFYCVEYISRCIQKFKEDLSLALHCSLWGNVEVITEDDDTRWDLERLVEICSMLPKPKSSTKGTSSTDSNCVIKLTATDGKLTLDKHLTPSPYCLKWFDKLRNCQVSDHATLHSILEGFRLKAIQDLNTLKRLIQKSETDHYSLYRAYQFLCSSGYDDILLYHVEREANVTKEEEAIEIISCLQDFIKSRKTSSV